MGATLRMTQALRLRSHSLTALACFAPAWLVMSAKGTSAVAWSGPSSAVPAGGLSSTLTPRDQTTDQAHRQVAKSQVRWPSSG